MKQNNIKIAGITIVVTPVLICFKFYVVGFSSFLKMIKKIADTKIIPPIMLPTDTYNVLSRQFNMFNESICFVVNPYVSMATFI